MGIVRMGVPEELVLFIKNTFCLNTFIETGTFRGDTSYWASKYFKNVFTIELSQELFDETVAKYRHLQNIYFRYGNSPEELKKIVSELEEPALFWLDAHYCSQNSAGNNSHAPILDELDTIGLSSYDHFILIDDARLFLAPPPDPHTLDEYPDICTLLKHLNKEDKYYVMIYDDVIVCVPKNTRDIVSAFSKRTITRDDKLFWAQKTVKSRNDYLIKLASQSSSYTINLISKLKKIKSLFGKWNKFINNYYVFSSLNNTSKRFSCFWGDRYPCLDDETANTGYERHYVLHPAWAMRILSQNIPEFHVDISSTLRFVTQLASIMPVKFYDYRPPLLNIENLECEHVDLTSLPFASNSIASLSCMHTIEHIGLGRYGDKLDADGDLRATGELARVLLPGGNLLVVVPVGHSRIEFNAHRIYSYRQVLDLFPSLQLKQYALIPDSHDIGDILYGASESLTDSQNNGCGCFWFTKVDDK